MTTDREALLRRAGAWLRLAAIGAAGLGAGTLGAAALRSPAPPARLVGEALAEADPSDERTFAVLFVFRPDECPGDFRVIRRLEAVAARGAVRVVGVLVTDPRRFRDWRELVRANRITFPVVRRSPRYGWELAASLGIRRSPFLVVTGRGGSVVVAAGPASDRHLLALIDSLPGRDSQVAAAPVVVP
ncbi:MAG TPA: hypothetical protein VNJ71_02495 [Gemmatimonadales bacterium]|nr:hypothetical protein [Gemmatimonadales bacterium]